MFDPDDMAPRIRTEVSFVNSRPSTGFYQPSVPTKVKKYNGSGIKFDVKQKSWIKLLIFDLFFKDWLEKKRSRAPSKPFDNEEEKRKAAELREIMAQEKFREWLNSKIQKRKESTLSDQEKFEKAEAKNSDTQRLSFEQWMENKRNQDRNIRKLVRKLKNSEDNEKAERLKKKMSFEEWMWVDTWTYTYLHINEYTCKVNM